MKLLRAISSLIISTAVLSVFGIMTLSAAYDGNLTSDTKIDTAGSGTYSNTDCGYRMYIVEVDDNGNPKGIISAVKDVTWCGTGDCNGRFGSTAVGGGTTQAVDMISRYPWLSGITKPIDGSGSSLYAKGAVLKTQLMANDGALIQLIIEELLLNGRTAEQKLAVTEKFNSNHARLIIEPTFKLHIVNDWSRSYRAGMYNTDGTGIRPIFEIKKGIDFGTYYGTISELLVKYNEAYGELRNNRELVNKIISDYPELKPVVDEIVATNFDTNPYTSYHGMNLSGGNMKSIIKMVGPGSLVLEADDVGLRAPANPSITDGNLPYLSLTAQNGGYGIGVFKANGQSVMIEIWRDVLTSLFL